MDRNQRQNIAIEAIIFDLDGTLVQTEIIKAKSYARAARDLSQGQVADQDVIEAFKEVVGLSRQEVAQHLLQRFALQDRAREKMGKFGVMTPWQSFIQLRLRIYESLLEDRATLNRYLCPYNLKLLKWARQSGFKTGLATMSHCRQAGHVLQHLNIEDDFEFVATRDDVESGKPDPQIYLLVARQLKVSAARCLVIEDSATGVKAALAAGMGCIAVTTDFTRKQLHAAELLPKRWIVDDPIDLSTTVKNFITSKEKEKRTVGTTG
jgi:HAD superfamily hydrolase (TIGR01549 family)